MRLALAFRKRIGEWVPDSGAAVIFVLNDDFPWR